MRFASSCATPLSKAYLTRSPYFQCGFEEGDPAVERVRAKVLTLLTALLQIYG